MDKDFTHLPPPGTAAGTEIPSDTSLFSDVYDLEPYEKTMKNARIWLYIIAGLYCVVGIFEYSKMQGTGLENVVLAIDLGIAFSFLGLTLWSRKQPVPAFTIALILFVLVNIVLTLWTEPGSWYKGLIFKIFAVVALVKGNIDARKYAEAKANLGGTNS